MLGLRADLTMQIHLALGHLRIGGQCLERRLSIRRPEVGRSSASIRMVRRATPVQHEVSQIWGCATKHTPKRIVQLCMGAASPSLPYNGVQGRRYNEGILIGVGFVLFDCSARQDAQNQFASSTNDMNPSAASGMEHVSTNTLEARTNSNI